MVQWHCKANPHDSRGDKKTWLKGWNGKRTGVFKRCNRIIVW